MSDISKPSTSLGRVFAAQGVRYWEDIYPGKICGKCFLKKDGLCPDEKSCPALIAIGGMASTESAKGDLHIQSYVNSLKEVLDNISGG